MGFWSRLFGRKGRRELESFEPTLFGGVEAIDPVKLMHDMMQLSEDVEKALQRNNPRFKKEVAARVDAMIERCQQFSQLGEATYVPFMDNKTFVRVDMSKSQQFASLMLIELNNMKERLNV